MAKALDLMEKRFGRLLVLKRVSNNKWGHTCWECLCDCGTKIIVDGGHLQSGHTQSCGCYNRKQSSKAHTKKIPNGIVFNYLTVIGESDRNEVGSGYLWYKCRCLCGNVVEVNGHNLRDGFVSSCGCYRKKVTSERTSKSIPEGTVFERLTVLGESDRNTIGSGHKYFKCLCDCGNIVEVLGFLLRNGSTRSCGCLVGDRVREACALDLVGEKYGMLTVLHRKESGGVNLSTKVVCQCDCGNITEVDISNLRDGHTTSCGCSNKYTNEETIASILENQNVLFEREFSFGECRDKQGLRFDFALTKDENCIGLIEYDGRQHYEAVDYFGGEKTLKINQKHDKIKNEYCKENSLPLLRIPYWEKKNIEPLVLDFVGGLM